LLVVGNSSSTHSPLYSGESAGELQRQRLGIEDRLGDADRDVLPADAGEVGREGSGRAGRVGRGAAGLELLQRAARAENHIGLRARLEEGEGAADQFVGQALAGVGRELL